MTKVRWLFVLLCGFELIPRSISLRGAGPDIYTAEGWALMDAGLDEAALRCSTRGGRGRTPGGQACHEAGRQLAALGPRFQGVARVVVPHLHADHSGHLKPMPLATLSLQRTEGTHAAPEAVAIAWSRSDCDGPEMREVIEGDREIMPGLVALSTPGHA